jgi:hypothetical protein
MRKQTNRFIAEVFAAIILFFAVIVVSLVLHGCAIKKQPDKFDPVIEHSEIKDDCETDCYMGYWIEGDGTEQNPYTIR